MKFINVLFFLIFNSILWSLINSVKNNKNQNELNRVEETSTDLNEILNNGVESSVAPQNQNYKDILKPKITKMYTNDNKLAEKKIKKKEDNQNYGQNNKEKLKERRNSTNYKPRKKEYDRNYYYKNKEKKLEYSRLYHQNNKEKKREYIRKYREKKKNEKEDLKNEISKLRNIQSEINEGTSFVLPQNNDSPKALDNLAKILNDGAESIAAHSQKYKEKLKTNIKIETTDDQPEKKLRKKKYYKTYYQKNKEKICEDRRNYNRRMKENLENLRKNKQEILQNINSELINIQSNEGNLLPKNTECENNEMEPIVSKENIHLEKGEDNPIQPSHNVEGNDNVEGTLFVNPQTDDCVNNLSEQPNSQSAADLHTQQMNDHDDLVDLSLLDDSDFLDYLNSILNS
ncbi:unnamed protein product [Meloidogyne enterolobii]|uniref:Uncharacterized protein n=1 Tax=Meloidogyne enterolobii TaxID=390850 RepID=A0ACB0Y617_MELEN